MARDKAHLPAISQHMKTVNMEGVVYHRVLMIINAQASVANSTSPQLLVPRSDTNRHLMGTASIPTLLQ